MSAIAKNQMFLGKVVTVQEVCDMIDAVTPEDLRRVARKIFRDGRRSVLFMGPKPSKKVRSQLKPKILTRFSKV